MAAKKKSKKTTKLKRVAKKKASPVRKVVGKKRAVKKTTSKTSTAKKVNLKKSASRGGSLAEKAADAKTVRLSRRRAPRKSLSLDTDPFASQEMRSQSAGQSGDLQGLSNAERADSESVDELIEEGNAFEADAVMGVESAEDEKEVRTHEVPEDDVPEEYLDKD
jgi:N utilization substance protein A